MSETITKSRKAIPVHSINGAMLTEGAEIMLLKFTTEGGGKYVLGIPTGQLPGLALTTTAMMGETARIKGDGAGTPAIAATSWRLGTDPNGEAVMTLKVEGGAEIAYLLPKGSLDQLAQSLEYFAKGAKAPAGETVN